MKTILHLFPKRKKLYSNLQNTIRLIELFSSKSDFSSTDFSPYFPLPLWESGCYPSSITQSLLVDFRYHFALVAVFVTNSCQRC